MESQEDEETMLVREVITNRPVITVHGRLQNATDLSAFDQVKPFDYQTDKNTRGWDNEAYDAITQYFWGKTHGIVLELGALDGRRYSVSADFLSLGWHRILIEATPKYAEQGPIKSPDATFVFSAICDSQKKNLKGKPQVLHYLSDRRPNGDGATNGIGEFMSPVFLKRMHNLVYEATKQGTDFTAIADWNKWSEENPTAHVEEIPCIDLATLFRAIGVYHVNFFMLDVEGGEMNVLHSIDWTKILFDVIAVETEPENTHFRPNNYTMDVTNYLLQQGYIFERNIGRNSWFRHHTFTPSKKKS